MSHFTCLKLLFLWSLSFRENAHLRALTSIAQDIFIEIEIRRDLKWEITQWHSPSVGICKIATCRFPNAKMKVFFYTHKNFSSVWMNLWRKRKKETFWHALWLFKADCENAERILPNVYDLKADITSLPFISLNFQPQAPTMTMTIQ